MDNRQSLDLHAPSKRQQEWDRMSLSEKKYELYLRQVELLNIFLAHHAISKEQYDNSLRDMSEKMGNSAL